jgi:cytochrome c-type biogenesis protein
VFRVSGLKHFVIQFGDGFAQGRPLEFEAVGIVNDAIEDSVGEGGFTDDVMPSLDGQLAGDHGCILFGLFMLGAARIQAMERDLRFQLDLPGRRPMASYVLGLAFGFGWTPCIGPILGAILTASAASATIGQGVALLAIYSAGLGIPFLIVAGFTDRLTGRLGGAGRLGRRLHQGAGIVMILMGLAMITGQLSALSYWLLDVLPVLGKIG